MNKYLEKIAALNPLAKSFARKVATSVAGDTGKINNVYNATSGVLNKKVNVFSAAEKKGITNTVMNSANQTMGKGSLYSGQALRAARAGARLARMQSKKVA